MLSTTHFKVSKAFSHVFNGVEKQQEVTPTFNAKGPEMEKIKLNYSSIYKQFIEQTIQR